ncbi:hypothetical protein [Chromohalobacter israelensis]|nr:hypothetical protein [Chromohalobacter salexigens]PWW28185.1 hypothetical protein DFO74_1624 [Chromohalobacter salexigens]
MLADASCSASLADKEGAARSKAAKAVLHIRELRPVSRWLLNSITPSY